MLQNLSLLKNTYSNSFNYFWNQLSFNVEPLYLNYFYFFLLCSLGVYALERWKPWRKTQNKIRKGFWLDAFYLIFNFSVFPIFVLSPLSQFLSTKLNSSSFLLNFSFFNIQFLPTFFQIIIFFIALDFIQWVVHILLHRIPLFWKFHQIHHSVEEMGFSAHFRFHWMEHIFYSPVKYAIVILLGNFDPQHIFIIHYIGILIGHLNHANIQIDYGPLRYILNNPCMHIWHHAQKLPKTKKYGVNFGISLSLWDYLFKTSYFPRSKKKIKLGFQNIEKFPQTFFSQMFYPFKN